MNIEGTGMTVNFGNLSMNLGEELNLIDRPTLPDEGQTYTGTIHFKPDMPQFMPESSAFVITYIENRKKKRKKRPNGTMIKHSRRKVDKCKVKIAFNGVIESADNGNVMIRKV